MRTWQVERRRRTRHLIELGGLMVKARVVDLTDDDRATILGALIWMANKLQSEDGEHARGIWTKMGKMAFEAERNRCAPQDIEAGASSRSPKNMNEVSMSDDAP
jgi:hypothetical protein